LLKTFSLYGVAATCISASNVVNAMTRRHAGCSNADCVKLPQDIPFFWDVTLHRRVSGFRRFQKTGFLGNTILKNSELEKTPLSSCLACSVILGGFVTSVNGL
jgi:hypothetical protein